MLKIKLTRLLEVSVDEEVYLVAGETHHSFLSTVLFFTPALSYQTSTSLFCLRCFTSVSAITKV